MNFEHPKQQPDVPMAPMAQIHAQFALACSVLLAVAPAWAKCSPAEDFKPFSERFIEDKEFRRQRTAEVVVIQYGQEDLVPNPKTEKLKRGALERRKLAIRTPEERKRDQLLESRSCAKGTCLIQQYVDGSDIENVYHFHRRDGCWTLTRITNAT